MPLGDVSLWIPSDGDVIIDDIVSDCDVINDDILSDEVEGDTKVDEDADDVAKNAWGLHNEKWSGGGMTFEVSRNVDDGNINSSFFSRCSLTHK